jgi:hypothetical protein
MVRHCIIQKILHVQKHPLLRSTRSTPAFIFDMTGPPPRLIIPTYIA